MESPLREGGRDESLRLIETLAFDGNGLVRGELHLARLARSAALLGWPCDAALCRAALLDGRGAAARLRLTLDFAGRVEVTTAALVPVTSIWSVGLAAVRLKSDDPWLTVKSSRRAVYDAARAGLSKGLDEVLFLNERAEVCDGTITSVFFDRGQGMRTPPLSCGLLPGVLRAEMLAPGQVSEEVLLASDLPRVRLWVGNSLRGLIPAVWAGDAFGASGGNIYEQEKLIGQDCVNARAPGLP